MSGYGGANLSWWRRNGSSVAARWGAQVSIRIGDRVIRGRAESLDAEGALLLRTQHGRLERIIGGDVTMEKDAA